MARDKGEGSIFQRRDGRWQASIQVDGHRRTVYGKTRQEARQKLEELKRTAQAGALPDPGRRTVADLIAAWLDAVAHDLKPRTLQDYRETCETYILPAIGHIHLNRLTPHRIQQLYADLQAQGKHRTAQKVHARLHRACKLAVLWRWLAENPCDRVIPPAYRAERKDVWTPAQLRAFLDGAREHWLYPLFVVAIGTGMRLGELLALTWKDVDLEAGTLEVRQSVQRVRGEYVITAPKTRAGVRSLSLPAEAVQALQRQRVRYLERRLKAGPDWNVLGLVFPAEDGGFLHQSTVQHALRRECERLGLPEMTMHGLRHLHASLLLEAGLSVPQVAKRLGHATPQVTMSIYAHVVDRDDKQAVSALQKALAGHR